MVGCQGSGECRVWISMSSLRGTRGISSVDKNGCKIGSDGGVKDIRWSNRYRRVGRGSG